MYDFPLSKKTSVDKKTFARTKRHYREQIDLSLNWRTRYGRAKLPLSHELPVEKYQLIG